MRARILTAVFLTLPALGQLQPQSAHVNLYFPQLADGGTFEAQWQTTFTFVNPNPFSASVALHLFDDSGGPLALDLGSGPSSRHEFLVPPQGIRILRSRIASSTIVVGWAVALATAPVQATVAFRAINRGVPRQEITAEPTLPTFRYVSAANRFLGVAIANPFANAPTSVELAVSDRDGRLLAGPAQVSLPPLGHRAFNLWQMFPSLQNLDFDGVLNVRASDPSVDRFVAWTLNGDASGTLSSLPPGRFMWPQSHPDQIWLAYSRVVNAALSTGILSSVPRLRILPERVVNAYARAGNEVGITLGLAQLVSDSPSELAFALAHEIGHIYQQSNGGRLDLYPGNPEFDADLRGVFLLLGAGYDPYAAAGTLAKLAMATGRAGLAAQFEDQLAADAHKSFNTRLEVVFDMLTLACAQSSLRPFCDEYKRIVHPNLPPTVPLVERPGGEPGARLMGP